MSVFGKINHHRLYGFSQIHNFGNFDHISRTYNQIIYINIWFARALKILIIMTQVLLSNVFCRKELDLNALTPRYSQEQWYLADVIGWWRTIRDRAKNSFEFFLKKEAKNI